METKTWKVTSSADVKVGEVCYVYMLVIISVYIVYGHHTATIFSPHIPFSQYFCSPLFPRPPSLILHFSLPLVLSSSSFSFYFSPSPSAPDQGEAIFSSNPLLILAQCSWKMYSRQTVGRCRLALGPQRELGSALMEHYFQPLHLSIHLSSLYLFPIHLYVYPSIRLSVYLSIYITFENALRRAQSWKQKP